MEKMQRSTAIATALVLIASQPAFADFINEPSASGLTAVNITGVGRSPVTGVYDIDGPVFDATGRQLHIGYSMGVPVASLTLNNQVGTYDVIGITGLGLAYVGNGSPGALTVTGDGAFIEADTTWFGHGNDATVNILDGGRYSGERTFLGLDDSGTPPGNVDVTVSGAGSILETETVFIGSSKTATSSRSVLTVSNGGTLSAAPTPGDPYSYGQIYVGNDSQTRDDRLLITGAGSRAEATDFVGLLSRAGSDRIDVLDGGTLASLGTGPGQESGDIWVGGFEAPAEMLISGTGSTVEAAGGLNVGFTRFVGFDDPDTYTGPNFGRHDGIVTVTNGGLLDVGGDIILDISEGFDASGGALVGDPVSAELVVGSGGTVQATNVIVNSGGVLRGNGGTILSDVTINGGLLAPGSSPGIMTIDGDLDMFSATIEIELGGTAPGYYDMLNISGNLFADSGTIFSFLTVDGFTLTAGDSFDIFNVMGFTDIGNAIFDIAGLGFGTTTSFVSGPGGSLALRIDSVGTAPSPVPLPAGGALLLGALALLGAGRLRRTLGRSVA